MVTSDGGLFSRLTTMQIFFRKMTLLVALAFVHLPTRRSGCSTKRRSVERRKRPRTKGYAFETSRDDILAGPKEGSLRAPARL